MHTPSMDEFTISIVFYSEDGGNILHLLASQKAMFCIFTSVRISYLAKVSVIITTTTAATAFLNVCVVKRLILQNFLVYNISCTA